MKQEKLLSVVIPVYNTEKYLEQTLLTIKEQTFKDYELILVNDGSTDATLAIMERFAKEDDRIKVISQVNKGPGAARNTGLRASSKFKYTMILDADDIYDKQYFEKMINKAEKTNADIVICSAVEYNMTNDKYYSMDYSLNFNFLPKKEVFTYKDVKDYVFMFCIGWAWDKLYRTSLLTDNDLYFQELKNTDDAYFVFISLVKAKGISTLTDKLVSHRTEVKTSTSNTRQNSYDCFYQAIKTLKKEIVAMGIYNEIERAFLNWALHFTIWNLDTLAGTTREKLYNEIKALIFPELGFDKYDKEFYAYGADYYVYEKIKNSSYDQYSNINKTKTNFKKFKDCLKQNGLGYTIKQVFRKLRRK